MNVEVRVGDKNNLTIKHSNWLASVMTVINSVRITTQ